MDSMREKWTDERLDDMNARMTGGFNRVEADLRELRSEMNNRFESMQRLIIQVGGGLFGTMFVGFLGLVLTQH
jgi:hypothetical protein